MYVLITYDIASTKKRNKVAALLEGFGLRVNYSVFELDIKAKKLERLLKNLKALCGKNDSLRVYRFSTKTAKESYELLERSAPFEKAGLYVD